MHEFIIKMTEVFREVHRVIRDDGTLWLNLGDSYAGSGKGQGRDQFYAGSKQATNKGSVGVDPSAIPIGLKQKDLCGIPWRVALALQADGWYLRSDIIWHKPNPMPESVTDRPTKAHEYLFLLTKSERYFYDAEAIKEDAVYSTEERQERASETNKSMPTGERNGIRPKRLPSGWDRGPGAHGLHHREGKEGKNSRFHLDLDTNHSSERKQRKSVERGGFNGKTNALPGREAFRAVVPTRNKRSVWTIATCPYPDAHFATFPEDLVIPCIKAGSPLGGVVLDPFSGAGTTAMVAKKLQRNYIGIELNPKYVEMSEQRIERECGTLF